MWPFKKKRKPAESIEKSEIPLEIEKTYAQWRQEYNALEIQNSEAEDLCAKEGDDCYIDEHLGFIKFGSRVDVFLPLGTDIKVVMGQSTTGNQTVIAELK